mgnify:CR=1 FL=1
MEFKTYQELRLKMLDIDPPAYLSKDIDIYEIRVSKEQRIHGYINKNEFNIVWLIEIILFAQKEK